MTVSEAHFDKKYPQGIFFSAEELWYLLGLSAPTSVIGIENPYTGRLMEEIEIFEEFALQSLHSRHFVRLVDSGKLEFVDEEVKSMIGVILNPEHCLWLTVSQGGRQKMISQRFVYFSASQILDVARDEDQSYGLTAVRDPEALMELLEPFLSTSGEDQNSTTDFVLEQDVLDTAMKAFDVGDDQIGKQILSGAGLKEQDVEELTSALGGDSSSMLAILISNPCSRDQCYTQGLGYMKGRLGGWIMKQYEQNGSGFVRFQSGTAKEFRESILSLVQ